MTFDPTDGCSLTELIRLVRRRVGDFPQRVRKTGDVGDGVITDYFLDHTVYGTPVVTVDGTSSTDFSFDADTGWLTFNAAPTGDIAFSYASVVWDDERIQEAINSAIDELWGKFYVKGQNDTMVTDGQGELLVETAAGDDLGPEDRITRVEYWSGSRWVRMDRWSVRATPVAKYVVWENIPTAGTILRVSYTVRPGNLDLPAETLEGTAGLPSRAKEPIVLLACSSLIVERMHHRIRDDRGHNTQGDNPVKSYEIQNDAQFLRAQAMLLASSLRMDSLGGRVVQ